MSLYEFGPFQLDAERLLLLERGAPIPIGPKVVETLLALIEHPGEVFPKSELLARIWPEGYVDEANLAQNIYVLRKTLRGRWEADAIETIPRRGYRFTAPVLRREQGRPEPLPAARPPSRLFRQAAVLAAALALALIGGSALTIGAAPGPGAVHGVEATRLYAIGRYYWNLRTREGLAKSIGYFTRVVEADPRDARGYAGLASAYVISADYEYGMRPVGASVALASRYAHEALALDPHSGEAYAVLGLISSGALKGTKAQSERSLSDLRRAIALDPASGSAHEWYGMALLQQGRVDEAYAELSTAAELEPLSVATTAWLGTAAYLKGRYSDAVAYARETLDLSPERDEAYETLGLAYEALGDDRRAAESFEHLARACPACRSQAAALLAALYARTNRMDRARSELAIARAHSKDVAPQDLAVAYEAVGQREAALTWLRRWTSDSHYAATEIANDPRFAALRRSAGWKGQKPA
ncbi:MAG TPA: winged helix-turn-helix domain-containing protein [Candidatus Binatia bacterium]|nr:winged helix-turn-helix domain-containing protein [Candidatus Binatia bacterium]